jgi:hypothetical protein
MSNKRRTSPDYPDAWAWLGDLAAAEGIDLERMSLSEAADRAVSRLEQQRGEGLVADPRNRRARISSGALSR